jgi:hypothetical protein
MLPASNILHADEQSNVDWVAVLTPQTVCDGTGAVSSLCASKGRYLPPDFEAQPVATSIAAGPDGWSAGELTGSRGHRVVTNLSNRARQPACLCPSAAFTLVTDGLTSIIDLDFGPDGTQYAVELDAAGWLATEVSW